MRCVDRVDGVRTINLMDGDTREIFEELTRGVQEEIASRRAQEISKQRRRVPRLLVYSALGVLVTTLVGIRVPLLGAIAFLGLTWLLSRVTLSIDSRSDH
jgi:hypothetical protein